MRVAGRKMRAVTCIGLAGGCVEHTCVNECVVGKPADAPWGSVFWFECWSRLLKASALYQPITDQLAA